MTARKSVYTQVLEERVLCLICGEWVGEHDPECSQLRVFDRMEVREAIRLARELQRLAKSLKRHCQAVVIVRER